MHLSRTQVSTLRQRLSELQAKLVNSNEEEARVALARDTTGGRDAVEDATEEALFGADLILTGQRSEVLRQIDEAVARVDAGTYGVCEECGVAIDFDRLMARPMASRCVACQIESERIAARARG